MAYTVKKLSELSGITMDPFHPKLAEFMSEGMMIFADRELK